MRALTIGELERESGVPRSTIYYYVRQGLLPRAQKASQTRALYAEAHVRLLPEIERLRVQGKKPAEIRERLAGRLEPAGQHVDDLVARRKEEVRNAILDAATRSFALKGYARTRMADLVAELGITSQLLYSHFATKRELFVACYKVAVRWMDEVIRPRVEMEGDLVVRQLWYMYADEGVKAFAPGTFELALEAAQRDEEARSDLAEAYEIIFRGPVADLAQLRTSQSDPPFSDELISQGLMGAFQQMLARAALDDRYSRQDVARHTLGLFLMLLPAYRGEQDLHALLAPYEAVLKQISELPPPAPPQ
jgi:AcrR family transcriptional regulator